MLLIFYILPFISNSHFAEKAQLLIDLKPKIENHPLHLGIIEINYNRRSKSLEITHQLFIDDMEDAIEEEASVVLRLGSKQEHADADGYIETYLKKYFHIKINGKHHLCTHVGRENDLQILWIYQEVLHVKKLKTLEVYQACITNLYGDQRNIVHFSTDKNRQSSILLDKHKPLQEIIVR